MQSLPRSNTAAKIPAEIILEKIYPRSCRLESAIERLLPSCDLYTDTDPATYTKLCSSTLVACEDDDLHIFSPDFTPSQALSAIAVLPGSRTLDWNDQAPLRSVLRAIPDEKFTVDLRFTRKRPPFYEFLTDIGFELLNERIGSGLLLGLLMHCSFFIPLENDCYLQITGSPIYNLNVIPIRKHGWSLSQRLRHVNRQKRKGRYCHKKRNERRIRKRKRKIECSNEPPSKRVRLEVAPATAPPSAAASQENTDGSAPMEVGGQLSSICQEAVHTELASTSADQMRVDNQTNGEVCNKTVCKSTSDGQENSDCNSESDMALIHSNSGPSLGNGHRKRKACVPWSLMSPEDKQTKRKKERNRKKKMIKKLEHRLESRRDLSYQQRKRIQGRLKRLRPSNRRKKHEKKEATATATNKEPSEQKKKWFINRMHMFYSATKQSFTNFYALQQLQPSVNGARKLVANIFEGRPIQDVTKNAPPDSLPSASSSVELPFVEEKPKRKTFRLSKRLQQTVPHFQQLLYNHKEKLHYAGLLNHYCPLSRHLLSLASGAGAGASTKPLLQAAVPPSSRSASCRDAFKPATTGITTELQSGAGKSVQEKEEDYDEYVSPEEPLLPVSTSATATCDAGGTPSSKAAAGVIEYHQGRSGLVTREQDPGDMPTSGAAAEGIEGRWQSTGKPPPPPSPPLKETIAQLVSQGKVSHHQVCAFVKAVLRHLVPMALWGSTQNRQLFFKHVEKFVGLGRFETVNVQDLMQGYKLSSCEWLKLPSPSGRGKPHPPSLPLCKKFLHWLMDEVVVRTIKAYFYVTEHSAYRNQVFFYRKELWSCVEKLAIDERTGSLLSHISMREMQWACREGKTLGGSKLRFLPKLTGVRPIINLKSRVMTSCNEQINSVNYQLNAAFHILNMEMKRRPWLVGSSCFGRDEVHKKLKEFATQQAKVDAQKEGPLLFVNTDIATCYDSILPDKLIDILTKEVLSQESYLLRRYSKIYPTPRGVKKRFIRTAITKAENSEPFYEFAFNSSTQDSNCILTDQIKYPVVKRDAIKDVLKKHLFGNLVKLGFKYFRQAEGIPQGSRVSTMLCGFYYANMEKKCLPRVDPRTGLLLRFVDDFLLITREPEVAREFLTTLEQGVPEYNCHINAEKTSTNFDRLPDGSLRVNKKEWMEWCGFLINTSTLNVKIDLSRYASTEIRNCVTIRVGSNPVLSLKRFIKKATQLRCLPLFLDGQLLSQKTVSSNVYESFVIVAMKFVAFIRSVPEWYPTRGAMEKGVKRKQAVLFFRLIMDSISWFVRQAKNICTKASGVFDLPDVVSWWLCCSAYRRVLEKHEPARMKVLIKLLSSRMTATANTMPLQWVKLSHRTIVKASTVDQLSL